MTKTIVIDCDNSFTNKFAMCRANDLEAELYDILTQFILDYNTINLTGIVTVGNSLKHSGSMESATMRVKITYDTEENAMIAKLSQGWKNDY